MPVVFASPFGFVLPPTFALGTVIPLFLTILVIWYLGMSGVLMKKGREFGLIVQRIAGGILIIMGILDTLSYWSL
jgi:cytochrome c-type biogenesis protein